MVQSVEGVHYIFDRYAFLNQLLFEYFSTKPDTYDLKNGTHIASQFDQKTGRLRNFICNEDNEIISGPLKNTPDDKRELFALGPDSKDHAIHLALRHVRSIYHSDQFTKKAKSIKQKAKETRERIDTASEILKDPEARPLYSEKLIAFYKKDTSLISTSGVPIIPLGIGTDDIFMLDMALSEEIPDSSAAKERIQALTGYNESLFKKAEKLFKVMPDDEDIRSVYKEALGDKLAYLDHLETLAWQLIGFAQKNEKAKGFVTNPDNYVEQVEEAVQAFVEEALPQEIEARNAALRIGTAKPPLLLTGNIDGKEANKTSSSNELSEDDKQKIYQTAKKNIEERAAFLKQVSQEKQEVLSALMGFIDVQAVAAVNKDNPKSIIIVTYKNPEGIECLFYANLLDVELGDVSTYEPLKGFFRQNIDHVLSVAKDVLSEQNVYLMKQNPKISDHYLESTYFAQGLADDWEKAHQPR